MTALTELLTEQHRTCDALFAEAEMAAAAGNWTTAAQSFAKFRTLTERHLEREESVLFPAFEKATGMSGGPTAVMRSEHHQMRDLMAQMAGAVDARDGDDYAGLADTLLMLMQQHNHKEENILYPMSDEQLAASAGALVAQLR